MRGDVPTTRPLTTIFLPAGRRVVSRIPLCPGGTLAAASSLEPDLKSAKGTKTAEATAVGRIVAERARAAGVERVVFDRAGFRYHGRVKSLADAAREAGLEF